MEDKKNGTQATIVVLDTNVILLNHACIYGFGKSDVVIPMVVLEELDSFKKGNDANGFHSREFTRELDELSKSCIFHEGVSLGENRGFLSVKKTAGILSEVRESFMEKSADHLILSVALEIERKHPKEIVVLITQDINLRMKARSLGMKSAKYEAESIKDPSVIEQNSRTVMCPEEIIQRMYDKENPWIEEKEIKELNLEANESVILKSEGRESKVMGFMNANTQRLERVEKTKVSGIEPRNAEQSFALNVLQDPNISLVSLTGKAGTGKTLLALAAAIYQKDKYSKTLLARPIVPLSNRDLGFLPGGVEDKIGPYMQPLFDNLAIIKESLNKHEVSKIEEMQRDNKLEITPLAYIRGRSLSDTFFIIDEAQNLTPHEIKTIITRAGEGCKIIICGDIQQIDTPYLDMLSNGLSYLTAKMKGYDLFAHVNLTKSERSRLAELASDIL